MPVTRADPELSRRTVVGYSLGSVGTGGFGTLPGLLLAYYLTDLLGVAALAASLVVLVPKAWDVAIAPIVGARSDAEQRRTGARRRLMLVGAVALPVLFAVTFAVPSSFGTAAAAGWVVVAFLLAATAFSCFQVPYIALPAEITGDYDARTRLMSWRIAALALAILAFGGGGPALRDAAGGGHRGYLVMGVVAGAVMGLGMLGAWWGAPRASGRSPAVHAAEGLREQLRAARGNQPFRVLLGVFVLQALATGAMLAAAQYVATYVLHRESAITGLFLGLVAPALLVMPAWARAGRRIGKERALVTASVLFLAAALSLVLLRWVPGPWVYGVVAVAGIGYAGMQTFPLAMLPDTISVDAARTGVDRAGSLAGLWTAGETAGLAAGPALVLVVLGLCGFVSSTAGTLVQTSAATTGIVVAFSLVPAVLVAASLLLWRRYPLRQADLAAVDRPDHAAGGVSP